MKQENQEKRRRQIEAAAYDVLRQKGYRATSMLAIAKEAGASNETLYKWYGNKQNLFQALVIANAQDVVDHLDRSIAESGTVADTMAYLGPALLTLVTSDKAIALNRAAAADVDETGTLGKTIADAGRETVAPLIGEVFDQARTLGELSFDDSQEIVELYLNLLIGDLQIRRVIGAMPKLTKAGIRKRADRAWRLVLHLYGT